MAVIGQDIIEKAQAAESFEEFMAVIETNGLKIPEDEAKKLYDAFKAQGEVSDDALDSVAGGASDTASSFENCGNRTFVCPKCHKSTNLRVKHYQSYHDCTCKDCNYRWIEN